MQRDRATRVKCDGHHVLIARDGKSALQAAAEHRPDVVLLDVGLPDMSGYDVARRLRSDKATSNAVLIAVTGHGTTSDRAQAEAAGIDRHLVKPVEPTALFEIVREAAVRPSRKI